MSRKKRSDADALADMEERLRAQLQAVSRARRALTTGTDTASLNRAMTPDHREAISHSRSTKHPAVVAARAAGFRTMATVAAKIGVSASFFSQVLTGRKAMPPAKAAIFERLTGYPAARWKA